MRLSVGMRTALSTSEHAAEMDKSGRALRLLRYDFFSDQPLRSGFRRCRNTWKAIDIFQTAVEMRDRCFEPGGICRAARLFGVAIRRRRMS
jgi:hypothetical protein